MSANGLSALGIVAAVLIAALLAGRAEAAKLYLLAFSWQPAFCETAPRLPECRRQHAGRFDSDHFTLHGLWPQPGSNVYCKVPEAAFRLDKAGRWHDLDTPRIAEPIWRELRRVMPGTRSALHRHEWVKHGVCAEGVDIDTYYRRSLELMSRINAGALRDFFATNIGRRVTARAIRAVFEDYFGEGTGERLKIACRQDRDSGRRLITGLTLGLADPFDHGQLERQMLAGKIRAAPATDPGCPSGIIDPVGLQ